MKHDVNKATSPAPTTAACLRWQHPFRWNVLLAVIIATCMSFNALHAGYGIGVDLDGDGNEDWMGDDGTIYGSYAAWQTAQDALHAAQDAYLAAMTNQVTAATVSNNDLDEDGNPDYYDATGQWWGSYDKWVASLTPAQAWALTNTGSAYTTVYTLPDGSYTTSQSDYQTAVNTAAEGAFNASENAYYQQQAAAAAAAQAAATAQSDSHALGAGAADPSLPPGSSTTLTATLMDATTGQPVSGAIVSFYDESTAMTAYATTDFNGQASTGYTFGSQTDTVDVSVPMYGMTANSVSITLTPSDGGGGGPCTCGCAGSSKPCLNAMGCVNGSCQDCACGCVGSDEPVQCINKAGCGGTGSCNSPQPPTDPQMQADQQGQGMGNKCLCGGNTCACTSTNDINYCGGQGAANAINCLTPANPCTCAGNMTAVCQCNPAQGTGADGSCLCPPPPPPGGQPPTSDPSDQSFQDNSQTTTLIPPRTAQDAVNEVQAMQDAYAAANPTDNGSTPATNPTDNSSTPATDPGADSSAPAPLSADDASSLADQVLYENVTPTDQQWQQLGQFYADDPHAFDDYSPDGKVQKLDSMLNTQPLPPLSADATNSSGTGSNTDAGAGSATGPINTSSDSGSSSATSTSGGDGSVSAWFSSFGSSAMDSFGKTLSGAVDAVAAAPGAVVDLVSAEWTILSAPASDGGGVMGLLSAIGQGVGESGPANFLSAAWTIVSADAQNGGGVGSLALALKDGVVDWGNQMTDPNAVGNLVGSIAANFLIGAVTEGAFGAAPSEAAAAVDTATAASDTSAAVDSAAAAVTAATEASTLEPEIAGTFSGGAYTSEVLQEPITAYRYSGGASQPAGSFLTTADTVSQISSPQAASTALNLPATATAETLNTFTIPAGTRIFTGGVAGGADTATQIYIRDPSVLIPQ